jgi:hypothetical protein
MKSLSRAAARSLSAAPAPTEPVSASREGPAPAVEPLLRSAIVATMIGLVGFLLIQGILAAYNVDVIRDAFSCGQLDGYLSGYSGGCRSDHADSWSR